MTDKTDSKERDLMALVDAYAEARHIGGCHTYNAKTAEARNAVIAKLAPSGFDAADMATAWSNGFRDGVASLAANSGSEPVAGMNEYGVRGYLAATLKCWHRLTGDEAAELVAMTQRLAGLYLHPSPPEGMVMVPKEPTEAMLEAVDEEVGGHCYSCSKWRASYDDCRRIWAAMIAAAPPTTSAGSGKGE